uniref:Glutamine-dependent NAD(+) synthetase n=1 Tax=Globodera rostochiensis TaxID=31243 RepID=A0A914H0I0_GLORO
MDQKTALGRIIKVAVCSVNQWALDFAGNKQRILKTCRDAYKMNATIRLGPELEITGYNCLDHFYELDTEQHSWEVLRELVEESKKLHNMMIITGMPIRHCFGLYNCMVSVANGKIVFIYPKTVLANDDVYREGRWFVAWQHKNEVVTYNIKEEFGFAQKTVPFGTAVLQSADGIRLGMEMCEEMWAPHGPSQQLALQGVDIICNSSGSHHVLGKSRMRINQLVLGTTAKLGGTYLYANHRGMDGERVLFDGMSSIAQDGKLYAQIDQFDIEDTAVRCCALNLDTSVAYRAKIASLCQQSSKVAPMPCVECEVQLLADGPTDGGLSSPISVEQRSNVEELRHAPAAWLWHYLRRSGMNGFFLPLSGGQDSVSVAVIVRLMCEKVCAAVAKNPDSDDPSYFLCGGERVPTDPTRLCARLLHTCFMGSSNSSEMTKALAAGIAKDIGATHTNIGIDSVVQACLQTMDFTPSYESSDSREVLALQNVQARSRMVLAYLHAQLALAKERRKGSLLVLGASNVDESLVGYVTKYDCSSADLNPIGAVSKHDLREFLRHVNADHNFPHLQSVIDSVPTAELRPLKDGQIVQTDEAEIGLTYEELSTFGQLRRPGCSGPYRMFQELVHKWHPEHSYDEIADKVRIFFRRYAVNRHKATIATPAYHANTYSNEDHRNDHRPFVYPDLAHHVTIGGDKASKQSSFSGPQ